MIPISGLLFDKDGTLLDFARTWPAAYRAAAADLAARAKTSTAAQAPALAETLLRRAGYDAEGRLEPGSPLAAGSNAEIAAIWAAEPALAAVGDVLAAIERVFARFAATAPATVPELADLFARLNRRGLTLGVATNDSAAATAAWLDRVGVAAHLDFVCGADSGHGAKPGPGMVRAFCAATGLAPAAVAVIGDTAHDLDMARAAGAGLAVAVLGGVGDREQLAPRADRVIASVAEVEAALADHLRD